MEIIQILIIVFAVFALTISFLRFRDNHLGPWAFAFWAIVWIGVIAIAIFPQIIMFISPYFGIKRAVSLMTYAGIMVLFYLVFRIYVKLEVIEKDISSIVRNTAIKEGMSAKAEQEHKGRKR